MPANLATNSPKTSPHFCSPGSNSSNNLLLLLPHAYTLFHSPHVLIHLTFHAHHCRIILNHQAIDNCLFRFRTASPLHFLTRKVTTLLLLPTNPFSFFPSISIPPMLTLLARSNTDTHFSNCPPIINRLSAPFLLRHILHRLHQHLHHLDPSQFLLLSPLSPLSCLLFILHLSIHIHQFFSPYPWQPPVYPTPSILFNFHSHTYRPVI